MALALPAVLPAGFHLEAGFYVVVPFWSPLTFPLFLKMVGKPHPRHHTGNPEIAPVSLPVCNCRNKLFLSIQFATKGQHFLSWFNFFSLIR